MISDQRISAKVEGQVVNVRKRGDDTGNPGFAPGGVLYRRHDRRWGQIRLRGDARSAPDPSIVSKRKHLFCFRVSFLFKATA